MSEFLEGGNHTTPEQQTEVTPNQEQQQSSPEGGQQSTPNVSEFDTIKYNKEDVNIPIEDRQRYLQQGYFYEQKAKAEMEQLRQDNEYLDRVAKVTGYSSRDELFQAIAEQEQQAQIEAEANRLGVTPEQYQQFLAPVNDELSQVKSKLQEYEQNEMIRQVDSEVLSLQSKYEDFKTHEQAVFELATQKGYSLEDSYILVTHQAKVEQARVQAQQQAIQSLSTQQQASVGSLSGGDGGHRSSVSSLSRSDFEAMKQKVLRGEIKNL